jgi:hypothetical protein
METTEKQKPGPKPIYGERKPCMTRLKPELVARLQNRIAAANEKKRTKGERELSFSEGMAQLLEWALDTIEHRERRDGVAHPKPSVTPKPITVSVFVAEEPEPSPAPQETGVVSIARGTPQANKDSPWAAICQRLRAVMEEEQYETYSSAMGFVSFENLRLTLEAANPFFLQDLPGRLGETIEAIASELCGEAVSVSWVLSPAFEKRQRDEEERVAAAARAAEKQAKAREENAEKLKRFYLEKGADAAKKAEELIFLDGALLEVFPSFQRKQIEQWLSGVSAGAAFQQGKESEYKGPRGRGRR